MEDPLTPTPIVDSATSPSAAETANPTPPSLAVAAGPLILWGAAACLLTLINRFAGNFLPIPSQDHAPLLRDLIAIPYLLLLLFTLLQATRAASRLPVSSAFEIVTGVILSLTSLISLLTFGLANAFPQLAPVTNEFNTLLSLIPPPIQTIATNFFGPIGLALLGSGIGRIIKHPNTLLAASGVAIFFDIVVVTMGTVGQLLHSQNASLISAVSVGAGAPPPPVTAGHGHIPVHTVEAISWVTIGPADVLFMAVFLAAVHRMNLSRRETFLWMFLLLGIALVIVQTTGLPIPALAPMGIAVLIANGKHAAFTRQERRDLKIGAVFAVFCAVLMVYGARRLAPPPPPPPLGFAFEPNMQAKELVVERVAPDSRAGKGGFQAGDAITAINGVAFSQMPPDQIGAALMTARAAGGTFTIRRVGKDKPLTITLPAATGR